MSQEIQTTEKKEEVVSSSAPAATAPSANTGRRVPQRRSSSKGRPVRREREVRDFEQKIISIRRVTRVVSGGRRFSFSVSMVIGDGRG